MKLFDRTFHLASAVCLAGWLIAVVPAMIGYAKARGDLSFHDVKHSAITIAAIVAFAGFWCLVAMLTRLLLSDWLATWRQQRR